MTCQQIYIYVQSLLEKYPTPSSANPYNSIIRSSFYSCFLRRALCAESTGSNIPEEWCDNKSLEHLFFLFFFKHSRSNTYLTLKNYNYSLLYNRELQTEDSSSPLCTVSLFNHGWLQNHFPTGCLPHSVHWTDFGRWWARAMLLWASLGQEGPQRLYISDKPDINMHVKSIVPFLWLTKLPTHS